MRDLYDVQYKQASKWVSYKKLTSTYGIPKTISDSYNELWFDVKRIVRNRTEILAYSNRKAHDYKK